jgi:inosine-uridine nucleoside N-ribohydrolase
VVDLLAVTVDYDNAQIVPYVDAIDTYFGYPDTPIGIVKQGGVSEGRNSFHPQVGGTFPHTFASSDQADSALSVLRRRLAAEPDHSVVVIASGFATNLAQLLASPPDGISSLSGSNLVKAKVKLLAMTAGDFLRAKPDFNTAKDPASAHQVFDAWPSPIVASEWQIGADLPFPGQAVADMPGPSTNPVLAAMILNGQNSLLVSFPYNPPSFDPATVLYAVEPDSYFSVGQPGRISLDDQMIARFEASPQGRHRLLQRPLDPGTRARITDRFVQLVNSPIG